MKNVGLVLLGLMVYIFPPKKALEIKTARFDKVKSSITYSMSHPMHNWDGVSKEVDGLVQFDAQSGKIVKVAAVVKIASFDSKNSNRDAHVLEVTEAIKYPSVTFVTTLVKDDGATLDVLGKVTFHNVTKTIHFVAAAKKEEKRRILTGNFMVLLEDFNIERPSLMMIKTANEMKMAFYLEYPL